jgi:4,5:9,10-diseco-3-hydroxy-5,9,17-trioxoandrosta-1(10),2-diene-4-oate hydrolase
MTQDRPSTPPFGRTLTLKQGYEMHYLEHGSGPPVVFVHGSGPGVNAYSNFFPNYREIAAAGYRAVMPDMIGFGWSSKPTGIDYTLELFVSTLGEFLDQMGIKRCVLLGNSSGVPSDQSRSSTQSASRLVAGTGGIGRARRTSMPGIQ